MRTFKNIDERINDARRETRIAREQLDRLKKLQALDYSSIYRLYVDTWNFSCTLDGEDICWVGEDRHTYDEITGEDDGSRTPFWMMVRGNETDGYIVYFFNPLYSDDLRFPINGTPGDIFFEDDRYTVFSSPAEAALNALDIIDEADQFFEDMRTEWLPFSETDDDLPKTDESISEGIDDELPFL